MEMFMNNKELEQEAENYAKTIHKNHVLITFRDYSKKDFIAGATSQYVEKEKLKFAIEQLKKLSKDSLLTQKTLNYSDIKQCNKNCEEEYDECCIKWNKIWGKYDEGLDQVKSQINIKIQELEQQLNDLQ